jgi:hypothetical protein
MRYSLMIMKQKLRSTMKKPVVASPKKSYQNLPKGATETQENFQVADSVV